MAKKSSKKDGGQRYDWEKIKLDYVTTPGSSLRKIAEKYGIRLKTVTDKSSADSWFATKREYQKNVTTQAIAKVTTQNANALAKELISVDKASDLITKMFLDQSQFNRHLVTTTSGADITTKEEIFDKVDSRALKDALSCLRMIEDMKRSMMEEQKLGERQKYEIEKARLALEQERLALERERAMLKSQATDEESKYGVVLMPEVINDGE